ncbi:MAG: NAD(P)-dependent oxidoreductase [Bacteroidia bacterium]
MFKVLLADENHPVLVDVLESKGLECHKKWNESAEALIAQLPNYDAIILRSKFRLTKEVLLKAKNLKCIGRVGAGMENIDVAFAEKNGIKCFHVPEGNQDAVGEHILGMLLMLLNNLKRADNEVRRGIWRRAENRGIELNRLTVGIIGYGHMGSTFAKKLSGIGCKIIVYDKYHSGFSNNYAQEVDLDTFKAETDVLSLHVPLTEETLFMVDATFINSFKKQIYVINSARGKVLKTDDLVQALRSGKVKGACLDVFEFESVSFESVDKQNLPESFQYLIEAENVVLSPHIAGWTYDSNYKMSKGIAEKIANYLILERNN